MQSMRLNDMALCGDHGSPHAGSRVVIPFGQADMILFPDLVCPVFLIS